LKAINTNNKSNNIL